MSQEETKKVDVQDVLKMLDKGISRKDIAAHYGLPQSVMDRTVWRTPELLRKRPKKQYGVEVFNSAATETAAPAVEETVAQDAPIGDINPNAGQPVEEAAPEETTSNWNSPEDNQVRN